MSNARSPSSPDYSHCLVKPMTEKDGRPIIEPVPGEVGSDNPDAARSRAG